MNASMARKCRYPHGWYKNRNFVDQSVRQKANQHVFVVILLDFVQNLWSLSQNVNVSKDNMPVQKKRKRRGNFLQDTWPGNLVQPHPARHPQTFINFFRSNCQPFHARSHLPWRSGFQRLSLQSSAVNFLKLFTFRIFTGVDRKSSALSCPSCVSCGCFFSTGSNFCVFFLFARWSYHHAWMPAVFPRCFDGIYTSMMKRTRQKLHHRNRVFRVFEQISGGGPWHRWRRTNPLKSHLEERGEIPPIIFFLTTSIN